MDLGISLLTDDQLVELLQEACAVLAQRDPIVREAAQKTIDKEAEKLKKKREAALQTIRTLDNQIADLKRAIEVAVREVEKDYIAQLRQEVFEMVQAEVNSGQLKLVTPKREAEWVVEATQLAQEALRNHVGPAQFDAGRRQIIDNLLRMGHKKEEIEKIYGRI